VAGGIAGLGTIGQNMSTQPPAAGGRAETRVPMTAPREIPLFRNHPRALQGPGARSITVIDEAEASV
jgi:hypothetical protein